MAEDGEKPVAPAPIEIEIPSSSSSADDHVPAQVDTNTVAPQSPTLTGSVQTNTQVGSFADNSMYNFVIGPDGQMVAVAKSKFTYKHFFYGLIPLFVVFFSIIGTNVTYETDSQPPEMISEYFVVELQKTNNTTYEGVVNFTFSPDEIYCVILSEDNYTNGDHRDIIGYCSYDVLTNEEGYRRGVIGLYNASVFYDDGIDHGEKIYLDGEFEKYVGDYDESNLSSIFETLCGLALIVNLFLIPIGFGSGKPGIGYGALLSLLLTPFASLFAVILIW